MLLENKLKIVHLDLAACSLFKDKVKLYFVLPPSVFLTKLQKQVTSNNQNHFILLENVF